MADNFLERKREDYEKRKAEWLKKQKTGNAVTRLHHTIIKEKTL